MKKIFFLSIFLSALICEGQDTCVSKNPSFLGKEWLLEGGIITLIPVIRNYGVSSSISTSTSGYAFSVFPYVTINNFYISGGHKWALFNWGKTHWETGVCLEYRRLSFYTWENGWYFGDLGTSYQGTLNSSWQVNYFIVNPDIACNLSLSKNILYYNQINFGLYGFYKAFLLDGLPPSGVLLYSTGIVIHTYRSFFVDIHVELPVYSVRSPWDISNENSFPNELSRYFSSINQLYYGSAGIGFIYKIKSKRKER